MSATHDAEGRPLDLPPLTDDRDRVRDGGMPEPMLDAMFDDLARQTVDHAPSLRERLIELSTPRRTALALALVVLIGAGMLAIEGPRDDLGGMGWVRLWMSLGAMSALAVAGVVASLRGLHRRPPGPVGVSLAVATLAAPIVASLLPGVWEGLAMPLGKAIHVHRACFSGGSIIAVLCTVSVLFLQRHDSPPLVRVLTAAGAGGLVGFVVQQAHCPVVEPTHLLLAHGLLGLVVAGVVAAGLRVGESMRG